MKGKSRRTQLGFGNMSAYGKADRAMQKSRRKETIHFNNNDKAWLALISLSFMSGMMKGFKGLMRFLFNNTSSFVEDPAMAYIPRFKPIKDEIFNKNPNSYKGWYKLIFLKV